MAIACKICIVKRGFRQGDSLFETQDELNEHLESYHHMPVIQEGETEEQAIKRFLVNHPKAKNCPDCIAAGAAWTKH